MAYDQRRETLRFAWRNIRFVFRCFGLCRRRKRNEGGAAHPERCGRAPPLEGDPEGASLTALRDAPSALLRAGSLKWRQKARKSCAKAQLPASNHWRAK